MRIISLRIATNKALTTLNKALPMIAMGCCALFSISSANALDLKQEQINYCLQGALAYKVADKPTAAKLCTCSVNVRSNMTLGQMWQIESYRQSGKDPLILPFAKQMQADLKQCSAGLTLRPPQNPNPQSSSKPNLSASPSP